MAFSLLLLRKRGSLWKISLIGATLGALSGFLRPRTFESTVTFIPQGSEGGGAASGLEMAASQFGIKVPTGGAFGPPVYVQLVRMPAVLTPLSRDTVVITEENSRKEELRNLLGVDPHREDQVILALRKIINPAEVKILGGVKISVVTRWSSVSLAIAQRLVIAINEFNLQTRRSQATAERAFVESQELAAAADLRRIEDSMQAFIERNRTFAASPQLAFQHDRLQRSVALAQSTYNSLVIRKVEARIRELRDTPLITVLEEPRLALVGQSRRTIERSILGLFAAVVALIFYAMLSQTMARTRQAGEPLIEQFFNELSIAVPRRVREWLK